MDDYIVIAGCFFLYFLSWALAFRQAQKAQEIGTWISNFFLALFVAALIVGAAFSMAPRGWDALGYILFSIILSTIVFWFWGLVVFFRLYKKRKENQEEEMDDMYDDILDDKLL